MKFLKVGVPTFFRPLVQNGGGTKSSTTPNATSEAYDERTGVLLWRWQSGVGKAVFSAQKAAGTQDAPKLKIGICGEHGSDANSVKFCHQVGIDHVRGSPFRVPISRLAPAQVVVEEKQAKKKKGK